MVVFLHSNKPCHAAKATTNCLESLDFEDDTLVVWPLNSPDIYPITKLWPKVKQTVYVDRRQFFTIHELWKDIKPESAAISR